jgi:hypothetical protein
MRCGEEDLQRQRLQAAGRRPSEEGALAGQGCQACQWGWRPRRVPNGVMGSEKKSGMETGVRDDDRDAAAGIGAEGRVRDGVGDGDDAASREAVDAPREVSLREVVAAPREATSREVAPR